MRQMIHGWFRYLSVAGFFGICINLIYLALPLYVMAVYDRVLFSSTRASLYALAVGVLISLAAMGLLEYFRQKMMIRIGRKMALSMADRVVRAMHGSPDYLRGLEDVETLRDGLVRGRLYRFLDLPWVILYLWGLYLVHPWVGAVAALAVFLAGSAQILLYVLEQRQYTLADVTAYANAGRIRDALAAPQLVSGLGMLAAVTGRCRAWEEKAGGFSDRAEGFHALVGTFTGLIHHMGIAAVFTAGALAFFADDITAGAIFAAVLMTIRIFGPLQLGLSEMKALVATRGAVKRLKAFVPALKTKDKFSLPDPQGRLSVDKASLAMGERVVLGNISLDLEPGQFLGVLGPAASGKSCLCRMLLGIHHLRAGKVRLDGAEIGQWPGDELGKHVGYLPQEAHLFEATVAENIARLGEPDPDKVVAAGQMAGAHEMILRLPQGYDTRIIRRGENLSASQRQMISLARAVYGAPKLVVLDTPQACLDEEGLKRLAGCLNRLKQEKTTVVMVTDKTGFLAGSDKILLIKEGQMAMYGPAGDVLAKLTGQQPAAAGV